VLGDSEGYGGQGVEGLGVFAMFGESGHILRIPSEGVGWD
jgi:hypothetical protein